jgi:hypothetical protein
MKRILLLSSLLAMVLTAALPAHAAPTPINNPRLDAPNIAQDIISAGRLRLQSQRLAKLYLQIGLGLQTDTARRQLSKGNTQFDADLFDLSRYARNAKTQRTLAHTVDLWGELKAVLNTPYSIESMKRVNYLSEEMMITTGKLTMQIENEAETPVGRLLDLSLRQSMLAQRLAKLYLMAQAGDKSRGRIVDVEQARKEFASALNELGSARENSPANRDALELAKIQWLFFENAIQEMNRGETSNPQHVATTSERIMEVLDAVSTQYAQDYAAASSINNTARLAGVNAGTRRN